MEYEPIYDAHGNYLGKDLKTVDKDGHVHITHYDKNDNRIGESYETTDWRGEKYITHEDANGRTIARSELMRDFWGNYNWNTTETHYGREQRESYERESTSTSSSGSSADGCLGMLFSMIFSFIFSLAKMAVILVFYYFKFIFLYFYPSFISAMTLIGLGAMILSAVMGVDVVMIGISIVLAALEFAAIPYWIILFIQKSKQHLTWKETFKYHGKWFLKGPLAYPDIIELTKRTN